MFSKGDMVWATVTATNSDCQPAKILTVDDAGNFFEIKWQISSGTEWLPSERLRKEDPNLSSRRGRGRTNRYSPPTDSEPSPSPKPSRKRADPSTERKRADPSPSPSPSPPPSPSPSPPLLSGKGTKHPSHFTSPTSTPATNKTSLTTAITLHHLSLSYALSLTRPNGTLRLSIPEQCDEIYKFLKDWARRLDFKPEEEVSPLDNVEGVLDGERDYI